MIKVNRNINSKVKFGLLKGISTPYELFNAKILLISKCLIVIITIDRFGLVYLFNGISPLNGLSNAEILFISKYLIIIMIIFSTFNCNHF